MQLRGLRIWGSGPGASIPVSGFWVLGLSLPPSVQQSVLGL